MGYLIRDAQTNKVPYTLVVGDDEASSDKVSVRRYGEDNSTELSINDFVKNIQEDISNYSRKKINNLLTIIH